MIDAVSIPKTNRSILNADIYEHNCTLTIHYSCPVATFQVFFSNSAAGSVEPSNLANDTVKSVVE
jgi:hypothetical protein